MPALVDSPPGFPAADGPWDSLFSAHELVKPRRVLVVPAAKKPVAYGGGKNKRNLETCTEALGCETGAVDAAPESRNGAFDGAEADCAERKRRASAEEEEEATEGRARPRQLGRRVRRGPLPPPLTTLVQGASRVRMVHERRDGRLAVYAVRTPGLEAERTGGRLLMRLLPCSAGNAAAACRRQEPRQEVAEKEAPAKEAEQGEEYSVAKYVRGGRCVEPECGGAAPPAVGTGTGCRVLGHHLLKLKY